ncbi:MAG: hypothetical protein ACLQVI_06295 [Polyangiaceae bacterium]
MTAALRFTRQVRLAEVGEEGQARLTCVAVRVAHDGLAGDVEARYLVGAGARVAVPLGGTVEPLPSWLASLSPVAREVASGAYAALSAVRATLSGEPHPRVTHPDPG